MTARPFRARITRIISRASRNCGVPVSLFWSLTPVELREIENDALEEFKAREELNERRTARLIAAVFNCHPHKKKGSKVFSENDFLPDRMKQQRSDGNRATEQQLLDKIFWIDQALRAQFRNSPAAQK